MLRRIIPDSSSADDLDHQYLEQLQRRELPELLRPNSYGLPALSGSSAASSMDEESNPFDPIHGITKKVEYLLMTNEPHTERQPWLPSSSEVPPMVGRVDTISTIGSMEDRSLDSVMEFFDKTRQVIHDALSDAGFQQDAVSGQMRNQTSDPNEELPDALLNAIAEFED